MENCKKTYMSYWIHWKDGIVFLFSKVSHWFKYKKLNTAHGLPNVSASFKHNWVVYLWAGRVLVLYSLKIAKGLLSLLTDIHMELWLPNSLKTRLVENVDSKNVWLQQYCAACHSSIKTVALLHNNPWLRIFNQYIFTGNGLPDLVI